LGISNIGFNSAQILAGIQRHWGRWPSWRWRERERDQPQ